MSPVNGQVIQRGMYGVHPADALGKPRMVNAILPNHRHRLQDELCAVPGRAPLPLAHRCCVLPFRSKLLGGLAAASLANERVSLMQRHGSNLQVLTHEPPRSSPSISSRVKAVKP